MEIALPRLSGIGLHLFVIIILVALAAYLCHYRKTPGVLPLIASLGARVLWLTCIVMFSVSSSLHWQLVWNKLAFLSGYILVPSWFVFILQVSGWGSWLTWHRLVAIIFAPAVTILIIFTNEWHGWFTVRGILHWLMLDYNYLLALVCWYINLQWIRQSSGLRRRQAVIIAIGPLFSFSGQVTGLFSQWVYAPMLLPVGFLLSALIWCWALLHWRTLNIIPIAKDTVITNMGDGFAVVDNQGYIYELNPAAAAMLGISVSQAVGRQAAEIFAGWPALTGIGDNHDLETLEAVRDFANERRFYQISATLLKNPQGYLLGKTIIIKDITEQKQAQATMVEQQKALSILAERNRLGRELHDAQGQFPGYVKTLTQAIRLLLQKGRVEDADRHLERLTNAADAAFTDVRESITGLKITAKDWDFFHNLRTWLSQFEKSSAITTIYTGPESRPPQWVAPEAEVQLLRIIQEVLVNARKHSGATRAEVAFAVGDDRLTVTIADNGSGFGAKKSHGNSVSFGLGIIRERAEEIGGTCKIRSVSDQGTVITVELLLIKTQEKSAI
ncbi:histidine kinase N-terminal 7TM domain-containing protein [Sporomusa malonica]